MTAHVHIEPEGFHRDVISYITEFKQLRETHPKLVIEFQMTDGKQYWVNAVTEEWLDALRIIANDGMPHLIRKHLIRSVTVVQR